MQKKEYSTEFGGKPLKVEISDLADQANGSVLVRYGGTVVFASAVMSKRAKEGMGFFPLTVVYEEKFYAVGKILGSRFMRREGRPSDEAVLTGRLIDRTIRPLFNNKIRNDIQVMMIVLSVDKENDPDIPAIIAASLALGISDIPWGGPVGAVRVGSVADSQLTLNPTYEERENSPLDIVICGKDKKVNMVEAIAKEISEETAAQSLKEAVEEITKIETFQKEIIAEIGKEKTNIEIPQGPEGMSEHFDENMKSKLDEIIFGGEKSQINELKSDWIAVSNERFGEEYKQQADDLYEEKIDEMLHTEAIENDRRPDGRKMDELRSLHASTQLLPITHGSGVFYRGGTHVLSVVTLAGPKDGQLIDGMEVQMTKHFMHHYNFPPFSVGETGRVGSPGRREIGHGALAEKALSAILPSREDFPYTIRIVSESMASNGSTSMGSVCASTLALMDAGVPIKNPVAGIAMGLMLKDENTYKVLTDIQGPEDHHGDMDFKCAGTKDGIAAIQMDVKVEGVPVKVLEEALTQAKKARLEILDVITKAIPEPRKELSPTAPRLITIQIDPSRIGEIIGPGGKMINGIIEKTGAGIDIEQDGSVFITSEDAQGAEEAKKIIEDLLHEYEVGEIIEGTVVKLFDFGAMVEFGTGKSGLIHVSELAPGRTEKVSDVVNMGDKVKAKVFEIDDKGRLNISIKRLDPNYVPEPPRAPRPSGPRTGYNRSGPPRR
jgi:polyribonucleotide nucleotidyltransferase